MGKFNVKPLVNKETIAIRFNKNTTLLKALAKDLVYKNTIIPLPRDKACNTKLDIILKEDSEKEKNNGATKLKDNTFNTLAALEKYINFAVTMEESKNRSHF